MKTRYDLVDPEAIHGIALAFTSGLDKGYAEEGWLDYQVQNYIPFQLFPYKVYRNHQKNFSFIKKNYEELLGTQIFTLKFEQNLNEFYKIHANKYTYNF